MLPVYLVPLLLPKRTAALVSPDGTGRLPAMGWNSWNEYACDINETVFLNVAQQLVVLGLKDLGYEYVNIDDCWSDKEKRRDPVTRELLVDKSKFPNGIARTAELIHDLGLKLGIYSDAGTETCGGYAGSLGFEEVDATTFSSWGVDYLKYDNCAVPENLTDEYPYAPEEPDKTPDVPAGYDYSTSTTAARYKAMGAALLSQPRTIQYSLCAWGHAHVERWGNDTGHSWRMWGDIMPMWAGRDRWSWGLMPIINQAAFLWNASDFWGHSDWDMLEVGNGDLTLEENRSHFAMWAALKSPLIIGTKLEGLVLRKPILDILGNRELIAFNQDGVHGRSARPFKWDGKWDQTHPASYWVGTSVRGVHLFLMNTEEEGKEMRVRIDEIPPLEGQGDAEYLVHDMWTGEDLGVYKGEIVVDVARHDTAALRITTVDGAHPNAAWQP